MSCEHEWERKIRAHVRGKSHSLSFYWRCDENKNICSGIDTISAGWKIWAFMLQRHCVIVLFMVRKFSVFHLDMNSRMKYKKKLLLSFDLRSFSAYIYIKIFFFFLKFIFNGCLSKGINFHKKISWVFCLNLQKRRAKKGFRSTNFKE